MITADTITDEQIWALGWSLDMSDQAQVDLFDTCQIATGGTDIAPERRSAARARCAEAFNERACTVCAHIDAGHTCCPPSRSA